MKASMLPVAAATALLLTACGGEGPPGERDVWSSDVPEAVALNGDETYAPRRADPPPSEEEGEEPANTPVAAPVEPEPPAEPPVVVPAPETEPATLPPPTPAIPAEPAPAEPPPQQP